MFNQRWTKSVPTSTPRCSNNLARNRIMPFLLQQLLKFSAAQVSCKIQKLQYLALVFLQLAHSMELLQPSTVWISRKSILMALCSQTVKKKCMQGEQQICINIKITLLKPIFFQCLSYLVTVYNMYSSQISGKV